MAVQAAACARPCSSAAASSSRRAPAAISWRIQGGAMQNLTQAAQPARQAAAGQRRRCVPVSAVSEAPEAKQQRRQAPAGTVPTRVLSPPEAVEALYGSQHEAQRTTYHAFYSSELGGIVTDPALFVVQLDDHMVHRGHAVFDTAILVEGHLYQLDQHLLRFLTSASKANISLPPDMSVGQLWRTILETAAASCKLNGYVRYWLSAGRGGFGLSGNECLQSTFYCVVYTKEVPEEKLDEYLRGWRVKTSPVPLKPPFFTGIKSTNYLPNALNLMDAEAEDFDQGIFVDAEGFVSEGPNMNLACLLADGTLVVPPFDNSLNGITVQRMMELLPAVHMRRAIEGGMEGIKRLEQRPISVAEAKSAVEVFMVGSSLPILPVVGWDVRLIGDGTAGLVALQIRVMMEKDMKPWPGSDQHVEVPYGFLTGMHE